MEKNLPIITKTDFFETAYRETFAKVQPRNFSSLTYRKSGKVSIFTTDTHFVSTPGTLTFIPSGCAYETEVLEEGEMVILHFLSQAGTGDFAPLPMTAAPAHKDTFLHLYERALRHTRSDDGYACMADAYRLLSEAAKVFFQQDLLPPPKLAFCKQYLDEHLWDSELRVSVLAELHATSEVYFRNVFKKHYHLSPAEYIKKQRLALACQLLKTKLYSVTEVATRVGFDSASYFSAEFHREFGCAPREYRDL